MSYQILRTDKADEQLRDIIFYIADDSGSVDIALNYLDKIEKAINNLKDFPYSGSVPHYATLRRQGYIVLIVERNDLCCRGRQTGISETTIIRRTSFTFFERGFSKFKYE